MKQAHIMTLNVLNMDVSEDITSFVNLACPDAFRSYYIITSDFRIFYGRIHILYKIFLVGLLLSQRQTSVLLIAAQFDIVTT